MTSEPKAEEGSEPVADESSEENSEEVIGETQETEEENSEVDLNSEDVLSQIDLDTMSEEELQELSEKLGSKAVARFGALTAKRKAAEERLAALEAELKDKKNPLESTKKIENNPFSSLTTIEELQSKSAEVDNIIEWAEDLLFESDGYAADDVITELQGSELTKADVRRSLLQARKASKTFLPDQLRKVEAQIKGTQLEAAFEKRAKDELSWLTGDDNDTRRQYESTISDPRFKKLKEVVKREAPEISGQLDYFFAHAANSIYGRKLVPNGKPSMTMNPPRTGPTGSAKSDKSQSRTAKAIKDLHNQFKQSGDARDFAALRKLQMASRH
jgi:nicotinamide mononucleotide adenylyltransferase